MDQREQRRKDQIARNEALFREVNERVQDVSRGRATEATEFVCECGDTDCTETVSLRDEEYERLRADPLLFAVVPGHVIPDVETIVIRSDGYDVVRKHEEEASIVRRTDPRS